MAEDLDIKIDGKYKTDGVIGREKAPISAIVLTCIMGSVMLALFALFAEMANFKWLNF